MTVCCPAMNSATTQRQALSSLQCGTAAHDPRPVRLERIAYPRRALPGGAGGLGFWRLTMTHTPGPWLVRYTPKASRFPGMPGIWREIVADGLVVAEVYEDDEPADSEACPSFGPDEAEANARLIAAAPELIDSLKAVVATSDALQDAGHYRIGNMKALYEQATTAVTKATGG